jgi:hypothetical protein
MESNISSVHHLTTTGTDPQRNLDEPPKEFGTKVRLRPWIESLRTGFQGGVPAITLPMKATV